MVWSEIRERAGLENFRNRGAMEGVGKIEVDRAIEVRGDGRGIAVVWRWAAGAEARRSRHAGGRVKARVEATARSRVKGESQPAASTRPGLGVSDQATREEAAP